MTRRAAVRACGYCLIGVFRPKAATNVGTLWRTAHAFETAGVFTIGRRYPFTAPQVTDTVQTWRHVPLWHFTDLDDLLAHLPYSCPLVGVELAADATPIQAFAHPERAVYLLGAEDDGLPKAVLDRCHARIVLPGRHCLNVAVAGSLVLYDRHQRRSIS